jgi:hypothetical protein
MALDLQSGSIHRLPPPCATHLSVLPAAPAWQPGSIHRLPPPCAIHLSVLPAALDLQSGSIHRLPPPCATHLSVLPWALDLQSGSIHRRILRGFITTEYSCDIFDVIFINYKLFISFFIKSALEIKKGV